MSDRDRAGDDEYDDYEDRPRRRRRRYEDDDEDEDDGRRRADPGDDPMMRLVLPVGQSGWAVAAGYLGLFSLLCVPGPFAVLAGVLALREIRRNPKKHGTGRAVFGIVMGGLATVGLLIFLAALVVEQVRRAGR